MDRSAAWGIAAAMPVLAVVFYFFTRNLPPFWGYGAGLGFYWVCVLVPLILWRGGFQRAKFRLDLPSRPLIALNALLVLGVAGAAGIALWDNPLPLWVVGVMVLGALMNGTLEEVFWRGTLLRDNASKTAQFCQIILFTAWHIALLFAAGVVVTGGAPALLGGAAFAGTLWTLARMQTGSIGFSILCHIGLNIFAFTEMAAHNLV